jgi:hypothetical protein
MVIDLKMYLNELFQSSNKLGAALVAHACNPSYSGGRKQKDHGSKPAQANSSSRSYLKKTHHKKGLVEWLQV